MTNGSIATRLVASESCALSRASPEFANAGRHALLQVKLKSDRRARPNGTRPGRDQSARRSPWAIGPEAAVVVTLITAHGRSATLTKAKFGVGSFPRACQMTLFSMWPLTLFTLASIALTQL